MGKAIEARGIVDAVLIKPIDDLRLYHQYIDMAIVANVKTDFHCSAA